MGDRNRPFRFQRRGTPIPPRLALPPNRRNQPHSRPINRRRNGHLSIDDLSKWKRFTEILRGGHSELYLSSQLREELDFLLHDLQNSISRFPCLSFRYNFHSFASSLDTGLRIFGGNLIQITSVRAIEDRYFFKKAIYIAATDLLIICERQLREFQNQQSDLLSVSCSSRLQDMELMSKIYRAEASASFCTKLVIFQQALVEEAFNDREEAFETLEEHLALKQNCIAENAHLDECLTELSCCIEQHIRFE